MTGLERKKGKSCLLGINLAAFVIIVLLAQKSVYAFKPLHSLLFGPISKESVQTNDDIASYIFSSNIYDEAKEGTRSFHKKSLGLYAGFVDEGQNLKNKCSDELSRLRYDKVDSYSRVKRSFLTTMQYVGLDIVSRYLPHYASHFEFSEEEYSNLIDGLVGNYCSQNMTVISLHELKKNFINKFYNKDNISLPSIAGNPLFPDTLSGISSENEMRKREFYYTIELFKTFCSWAGEDHNYRLMAPFVRHPAITSHIIREMTGKKLDWSEKKEASVLIANKKSNRIICEGFICRKTSPLNFVRKVPTAIGSTHLKDDLERMYCFDLKDADYQFRGQAPRIKKIIGEMSLEKQEHLTGHFNALITGVPDFILQAKTFSQGKSIFRLAVDRVWQEWSEKQNANFDGDLFFEESLIASVRKESLKKLSYRGKILVNVDFLLGEYDRIGRQFSKLTSHFELRFSRQYISWLVEKLQKRKNDAEIYANKEINESLQIRIRGHLLSIEDKFNVKPWRAGLENIIARSFLRQLIYLQQFRPHKVEGDLAADVNLNYGLYALKYIRFLKEAQDHKRKESALSPAVASSSH